LARQYGFTERHQLSDSDPRDAQGHDEQPKPAPSEPPLVFKPDAKQAARVARVRTFTLVVAATLMVVALFLIISFRPPPVVLSGAKAAADTAHPAASSSPSIPQPASQPAVVPRRQSGVDVARSAAAEVDKLVAAAAEKWRRAAELLPPGVATSDNAPDAAANLRKAVVIADSARHDIALARQQAEMVLSASRKGESMAAFRLGVLYAALDRYLEEVGDDAEDRLAYYAKSEASVKATLLGDEAESEIQQNVANSYLRSSEGRQAGIKRLAQQVREALGNLESARR
jgi:hypothetical protein